VNVPQYKVGTYWVSQYESSGSKPQKFLTYVAGETVYKDTPVYDVRLVPFDLSGSGKFYLTKDNLKIVYVESKGSSVVWEMDFLNFPLFVGKKWTSVWNVQESPNSKIGSYDASFEVIGYEKFDYGNAPIKDAFEIKVKITSKIENSIEKQPTYETTYFYVPSSNDFPGSNVVLDMNPLFSTDTSSWKLVNYGVLSIPFKDENGNGIPDFLEEKKFLPDTCTLQPGLGCVDFKVSVSSINITIVNNLGIPISNIKLQAENCLGIGQRNSPAVLLTYLDNGQKKGFGIECNPKLQGDRYEGKINFSYKNVNTGLLHINKGLLSAKIEKEESKCTDSDGLDYYIKGDVTVCSYSSNSGSCGLMVDKCEGTSSVLTENYCDGNNAKTMNTVCLNGCKDGACIKEASKLTASINKPYLVNKPFTISAWAKNDAGLITSVDWDIADCSYAVSASTPSAKKMSSISSYVTASVDVQCSTFGLKTFSVKFADDKGNSKKDYVNIYVSSPDEAIEETPEVGTTKVESPSKSSTATQQSSGNKKLKNTNKQKNTGSCQNSCGGKTKDGICYCDTTSVSSQGDYCMDILAYCPNLESSVNAKFWESN